MVPPARHSIIDFDLCHSSTHSLILVLNAHISPLTLAISSKMMSLSRTVAPRALRGAQNHSCPTIQLN